MFIILKSNKHMVRYRFQYLYFHEKKKNQMIQNIHPHSFIKKAKADPDKNPVG
jgi:hypothetical protein